MIAFATAVIVFVAAIISVVGSIVQLRANVLIAKTQIASSVGDDNDQRIANLTGDYWLPKYFWRKQKLSLLLALLLLSLPFSQARLTGTSSVAFIFIMVHSTIMFYGVCYAVMKMAGFEFAEEYRKRKEPKP